ncbi:MAG: DUF305 domain-containing protein [Burkholderiales bacterium]|nr:MAG: DUF305 domain-containing protein [Burkholderiales bacterium]
MWRTLRWVTAVSAATAAAWAGALTPQQAFQAENDAAMQKMMADMEVKPSGDIDRDFAAMMIPHHQGAIDMAVAQLRYGKNEQMRRIAQEIIVEQQQEIAAMHLALGEPAPTFGPAPTQPSPLTAVPTTPAASAAHRHSH